MNNAHLFLDTLLMKIRSETITYSSRTKNENHKTTLLDDKKQELQELKNIRLKGTWFALDCNGEMKEKDQPNIALA